MRPTTITLNDREAMQIGVSEHEGRMYANVQVFFRADNGELLPTKKGIIADAEVLPDLIAVLTHLDKALNQSAGAKGGKVYRAMFGGLKPCGKGGTK